MSKDILVVGFYTKDTPYEHEKETLQVSLEALGYEYNFKPVENLGTWQKNTQYKAHVLKEFLQEYPGKKLLYLDVDAIMVKRPVVLDTIDCDIAAVHYHKSTELLSGTIYFAGTPVCLSVVHKWIQINEQYPVRLPDKRPAWDQRTLQMAMDQTPKCRFEELPQNYTFIVQLTEKSMPGLDPVILHTRGARRFKNIIDGKQKKEGYAK